MISVNNPLIGSLEQHSVSNAVHSGWIASGPNIEIFEKRWAAYCGKSNGVAVSNGTSALQLAVEVLQLPEGSEVILPSFTIISCANAIIKANLRPVFVDVDPETWCIDPNLIKQAITPKTKAIMPVHIYGHPADMEKICKIAVENALYVIEDAAEAHGGAIKVGRSWKKCGSFGDVSCFSFYSNKIITTGEGGMVLTNMSHITKRLRGLRNLCFGEGSERFIHTGIGYNYRMTNLQAAIGCAQLSQIDTFLVRRKEIDRLYRKGLSGLPIKFQSSNDNIRHAHWVFGIVSNIDNATLGERLLKSGVDTRPFFYGLHKQPVLSQYATTDCPVTNTLSEFGLYLPSGPALTDAQITTVCRAVRDCL